MPVTATATSSNFPGAQLELGRKHNGTAFVAYLSDSAKNRVQNSSDPRVPGGRGLIVRILKYRDGEEDRPVGDIAPGDLQHRRDAWTGCGDGHRHRDDGHVQRHGRQVLGPDLARRRLGLDHRSRLGWIRQHASNAGSHQVLEHARRLARRLDVPWR
jgi:hypothetical protein